jgi:RNA polymerase-interacting CarD/CdnL/TRCF family regulator
VKSQLYYVLRIKELSIWVPVHKLARGRMRLPSSARVFKRLLEGLADSPEDLSDDRRERKLQLHTRMSDGTTKSIWHVLRDLTKRELKRSLNDNDRATLERARALLLGEWVYALQVPPAQAEHDLHRILRPTPAQ